jgi:nicotinamidase-related amidase
MTISAAQHVLLLIDVQVGTLSDPPAGIPNAESVRDNIAQILTMARAADPPPLIVHVRNAGDSGEPDEKGAPGWELLHPARPGECIVDKKKNNAFADTRLASLIPTSAEVVVVGSQSDYCIRASEYHDSG